MRIVTVLIKMWSVVVAVFLVTPVCLFIIGYHIILENATQEVLNFFIEFIV